ncbi:hypothetical protein [Natrinema longum]|uniref:Uncharacterized protein n=1 Tax=Natrinema longum TaxID=370324 RepID=A0A8A2UA48_9EURY|nr:hypothetical protein [Natrinema longum]MBZ6496455.1 hypothetical protein [Natrinema longum]QSW85639.1 hypothetical protein J0X27_01990 [Natrinema longum]
MSTLTLWPWAALALVIGLVLLSSTVCLCYAIGTDANARGANGIAWAMFAILLLPIAIPAYGAYRTRLPARDEPPGSTERRLGAFGIGTTTAFVVSALVSPPDPFTQLLYVVPLVVVFVPLAAVVCYEPGW